LIRIAITERAYRAIKTSLPQDMALKPVERSTTGKTFVCGFPRPRSISSAPCASRAKN
jgi:hypothetical protein